MKVPAAICLIVGIASTQTTGVATVEPFAAWTTVLSTVVHGSSVDYVALKADRRQLDAALASFRAPRTDPEPSWPRDERFAFWINAYNVFTVAAIVDHYPIRGSWFSFSPRSSIRQIDGVWTRLKFRAAGRDVTLDEIEHEILRPTFRDPRLHFAINCASKSCPALRNEPYVADRLDAQLDDAARRYLASPFGIRIGGERLEVSSIFKWYGEDFVLDGARAASGGRREARDRAVLAFVARYGPEAAAALARSGRARLDFLDYDWTLNDREP